MERTDLKKGIEVTYIPRYLIYSESYENRELGKITSWNDKCVFVDYGNGIKATPIELLEKGDKTFYCYNENNSVLHGAFGRCEKKCNECS